MNFIELSEGRFLNVDLILAVQIVGPSDSSDSVSLLDGRTVHRVAGQIFVWFGSVDGTSSQQLGGEDAKILAAWFDQHRR